MIPSFKDRDLLVHLDGPPGTSRPEMSRIVARASRELRAVPGVDDVGGHVGRAVTGDQVVDVNSSELWVQARPRRRLRRDAGPRSSSVVDGYPGFSHDVVTYEKQRIRDVGALDDRQAATPPRDSADLDVLTGADRRPLVGARLRRGPGVLRQQARADAAAAAPASTASSTRGSSRWSRSRPSRSRSTSSRAQRYGIKPGDVRRAAATLLSGIQVGSLFEQQKVFDVVVRAHARACAAA